MTHHLVSSLERPWIALAIDLGQNRCTELLVFNFFDEQVLAELLDVLWLWIPWLSLREFAVSNIGWSILLLAFMNQLFTWSKVRFVCEAIVRFSSSVGYGCYQSIRHLFNSNINKLMLRMCYHNVLEEPRPHYRSGLFWENSSLLLFLFIPGVIGPQIVAKVFFITTVGPTIDMIWLIIWVFIRICVIAKNSLNSNCYYAPFGSIGSSYKFKFIISNIK